MSRGAFREARKSLYPATRCGAFRDGVSKNISDPMLTCRLAGDISASLPDFWSRRASHTNSGIDTTGASSARLPVGADQPPKGVLVDGTSRVPSIWADLLAPLTRHWDGIERFRVARYFTPQGTFVLCDRGCLP